MAIAIVAATNTTAFTYAMSNWAYGESYLKLELRAGTTVIDDVLIAFNAFTSSGGELTYNGAAILFTVPPATTGVDNIRLLGNHNGEAAYASVLFTYTFDTTEIRNYPNGGTYSLPGFKFNTLEE